MSYAKYSPTVSAEYVEKTDFVFNCFGCKPAPWTPEMIEAGAKYDEMTMYAAYDAEGYDCYGYSAFLADGTYRFGGGIDRAGRTEDEYLAEYNAESVEY